jgi:hypothetical protein
MPNWYLYYRLLHAVPDRGMTTAARIELQGVLVDLLGKAVKERGATRPEMQDFMERMARIPTIFAECELRHLINMEPWGAR